MLQKKHGFTLIELLVVIAIIAILAAILFPVFAKARNTAKTSSCANNMKQLSTAVMMYAQEFDQNYPWGWGCKAKSKSGSLVGGHPLWLCVDYAKSKEVYKCPSDDEADDNCYNSTLLDQNDKPVIDAKTSDPVQCGTSYGMNGHISSIPTSDGKTKAIKTEKVSEPARTFMINESKLPLIWLYYRDAYVKPYYAGTRHNKGSNTILCDGHATFIQPDSWETMENAASNPKENAKLPYTPLP